MSSEEGTSNIHNLPEEHFGLVDTSYEEGTSNIHNLPMEHLDLVDMSSKESTSIIHNLPEELLLKIFSYVSHYELFVNVRNVCSLWKNYALSSSLWKQIDVQKELADFNLFLSQSQSALLLESIMESISFHMTSLKLESDLRWKVNETTPRRYDKDVCTFAFPKLQTLELDISSIYCLDMEDCEKIAQLTKNLKMLKLICKKVTCYMSSPIDVCHFRSLEKFDLTVENHELDSYASNKNLPELFQYVSNITHFKSTYLNSNTVRTLLNNCPSLEVLTLNDCPDIDQDAFDYIPLLNNMKSLSINGTFANDNGLKAIVQNTPNLEHLSVQQSVNITDVGISFVGIHCNKLKRLIIEKNANSKGRNITNIGIDYIARGCPDLQVIVAKYCEGINDNGVHSLAKHCRNLLSVKLSGCPGVTDTGIEDLSNGCRYLEHVNFNKCVKITHKSINRLIGKCLWLQTAKFNSCNKIYNLDFRSITRAEDAIIQNTERDLKHKTTLKAHNVTHNIRQHSHIRKLSFKFCPNIDGDSIKQIADYCPDLREVYLTGTHIICDEEIHYLLQKCLSIRILDISGGSIIERSKFTNTVLSSVGTHGQNIEKLMICKNSNISKPGVLELLQVSQRAIDFSLSASLLDLPITIFSLQLKDCQQLLAEYGNTRATLQYTGEIFTQIGFVGVNIKKH